MRTRKSILLFLSFALVVRAADDIVMKAMRDELARSMKKLQLENLQKPYFIAYRVVEGEHWSASASFGSLTGNNHMRMRQLAVDVRVGDYALDNSHFLSFQMGGMGVVQMFGSLSLPLDDNYDEIRRQIWLATDGVYKKALEDLSKKQAALQNQNRTDTTADLSKETPVNVQVDMPPISPDLNQVSDMVRSLSRVFREAPGVFASHVSFNSANYIERFVNSEGSSFVKRSPTVSLIVTAGTQAPDGMDLSDYVAVYGRSMADLPAAGQMETRIRECAKRLEGLRAAAPASQYNGPVLFEGEAAAGILAQAFLHNVLGRPRMIADNPQMSRSMGGEENGFVNKIGARVLPEWLSLIDDPTAEEHYKHALLGGYKVDEDAVAARRTVIVEKGILKTLLTSRAPVRRVPQSTGHRRGPGVMPSNVFLLSDRGMAPAELKAQLLKMVQQRGNDYGVIVRSLVVPAFASGRQQLSVMSGPGGATPRQEHAILAYKIYPDGREELMRNAELSEISAATFKEIAATGKTEGGGSEANVYTLPFQVRSSNPFGGGGLFAGPPVVTFVVPSLLFEDVSINRPLGEIPKPPASEHPFFGK